MEGRTQRLRQTSACLQAALAAITEHADELTLVLTLGDIIDGNYTAERTAADFEKIASMFDPLVSRSPLLRSDDLMLSLSTTLPVMIPHS